MRSQPPIVPSLPQLWIKKIMKRLVNNFTKLINGSLQMWSRRRSNSFSAPTFSLTTIYQLAMSEKFHPPTCLQSSCHYLTLATSKYHLPSANVKITHGHFVMGRHFTLLNKYSLKARSDLQTGLITKTLSVATYQPLGHSFLAEKYPTVIERSHPGQKENSLTPSARKARANRISSWGRCIEGPLTILPTKPEATRWLNSV